MSLKNIAAVDYSDKSSWLAFPEKHEHGADTVYLYPTCYYPEQEEAPIISSIDDPQVRLRSRKYLELQASVFAESTDVYVPHYRQCSVFSLAGKSQEEILKIYQGVPCLDVFAALDYYFTHVNGGRPFILAGHSQGSVMALFALGYYFAKHPEYYRRMAAAYCIGFGISRDVLQAYPHLKMAQGRDDTGVIISYNTEAADNGTGGRPSMLLPPGTAAINPLNWRTDETYAPLSLNKGSLHIDENGRGVLGAPLADAKLNAARGTLVCSPENPEKYYSRHSESFGPKSFHSFDYAFYYANLQENVGERLRAFSIR
ncbi:DUF3089 domain-containing protein [bacterium]|nr:DUF3089 domain-containing protein [bacterium]